MRGQYDGYLDIDGVADGSTTETFIALRLYIDNWRWHQVPFYIRAGKKLATKQTELRLVFREPPPVNLNLGLGDTGQPTRDQFVIKLDPTTGARLVMDARRGDQEGPAAVTLDVDFAEQGGEAPTPYEVLLHAASVGDTNGSSGRSLSMSVGGSCSHFSTAHRLYTPTSRGLGAPMRRTSSWRSTEAGKALGCTGQRHTAA